MGVKLVLALALWLAFALVGALWVGVRIFIGVGRVVILGWLAYPLGTTALRVWARGRFGTIGVGVAGAALGLMILLSFPLLDEGEWIESW